MANPSFQVDDELLEQFDQIILQKKAQGELDPKTSRSDVLRDLVEEYVEGNWSTSTKAIPQTAD